MGVKIRVFIFFCFVLEKQNKTGARRKIRNRKDGDSGYIII
jgi:hypothetical protein